MSRARIHPDRKAYLRAYNRAYSRAHRDEINAPHQRSGIEASLSNKYAFRTYEEIGFLLGLSRQTVRAAEISAFRKIRKMVSVEQLTN